MEKLKQFPAAQKRLVCILLALICMLGLLPSTAFAAGPNTIVMEDCTHNGVYYESAALSTCWLHQMKFDYNGDTVMGFCADHGGGMGWSLEGHEWNNPREITDPTVKTMLAYFYAHSRGIFTDQAHALGVDEVWSSDYTWTMNAWVQAVVWRYQENLFSDPVAACAEELLYVYNNLEHTNYTSIDDVVDGTTLRDRAQYILDLGAQGVWGDCKVYEYDYAGPGSAQHPAYDVQSIIIGDLTVTRERYQMTVKKVDATNPNLALPGARFLVQNANGTFSQEVVTGSDGTVTLTNLEASTYSVTELDPPDNYQIDNAGPQYVVLPSATGETTATVTFTDTPIRTGEGSIRKVDADDPTKGLAGAVIKIEGVDNEFVGTYITGAGGYLEDVPWDAMPIGSFVASEVTPPNGYTTSNDPDKVRQEFYWDGKHDVDLIFENDAKVKVQLIKLDDSDDPIEGAVFNVVKDGQVVATEATDADGRIIVPNVTEGMYAFFEVSVPAPYAKLQQPVIAHVDQATVDGGGTVTVTAVDQMLPTLTILKRDGQTGEVVPGAVFEITGIHYGYHMDVTTGPDGTATLTGLPVDSYEVTEISVPDPYVVAAEPTQTIWLGPGDDRQLIFDIVMDGMYYTYLYIRKSGFPQQVRGGWMSSLINAGEGVDVDLHLRREIRGKTIDRVAQRIRLNRTKLRELQDTSTDYEELAGSIQAGYYIKQGLSSRNEDLFYMTVLITVSAPTLDELQWRKQQMTDLMKSMDIQVGDCLFQQEAALRSTMPFLYLDPSLEHKSKRNVLTSGAASTYMFTSFELSDDNGILLGLNRHNNSLCIVDPFNTKVNKNANFTICGTSGAGKTFTMQVMALRLRMRGVQCYILAPLKGHEFKRACHKIGGTYIKLAPGSSACINVMEIRPTLTPEMELIDELDYSDIDSMLAKKIQQLMIFFSLLIPDMSNEEEQLLDEALVKTYANFGITHDNSSIYEDPGSGKVKTMPILGDLYEVLKESPLTARLATIVSRFVTGSAQSFNRQSNINLSNRYVVLDISELKGKMLPVGMMIALDYVWDQVKADRTKKKMVFIDEIWKLIGGSANRQAAEFCLEIFKIIRGYGGGAVAATQDLSDFFGLEDGRYGRSILNNSKTKIILNLEPDEAEYVKDVLKLTRTEIRSITQFERGEALISSNSNKVPVIIKASREEQQMITTDRAELEAMLNELKAVADTAEAAAVPDGEAVEDSRGQALS